MNLRAIRKKIRSISNVKKITKAMQLVSAVKMKKAQQEALESVPFRTYLDKIIKKAVLQVDKAYSPLLFSHNKNKKNLYLVITSNKGMCGSFNFSIFRYILKNIDYKNDDFVSLGKKGSYFLSSIGGRILADFSTTNFSNTASAISKELISNFINGNYEKVYLLYNHFISAMRFETKLELILPVRDLEATAQNYEKKEHLIEPSPELILNAVLVTLVEEKIRGAIIESQAAEHSARMIAMKNATDNATDIIYNLTLLRNKVRQEKITYELLDMVSAKISVEGNQNY